MKANPKKLGGRKGDRMSPDWLSGYIVVELTSHQVVLRNTKTNKVLKGISVTHIKPFREREINEDTVSPPAASPPHTKPSTTAPPTTCTSPPATGTCTLPAATCTLPPATCTLPAATCTSPPKFAGKVEQFKQMVIGEMSLHDSFLDFGPVTLSLKDLWSLIPPQEVPANELKQLKREVPHLTSGWLTDMVRIKKNV